MKKIYFILFLIFALFLAIPLSKVYAVGSITVGGPGSATTGDTFTINVNVSGATFATAGGKLNFDSSKVEYVSHSGAATYNSGTGVFGWTDTAGKSSGSILSVTFRAKLAGSTAFSISSPEGVDMDLANLGPSGGSLTVTISDAAPPAKSSNANLSNLGIRPNDFSGFKAATTTYNVTVPNSVGTIEVYASVQDSKATVSGTGKNKSLKEGKNVFEVVVTAENGTKKTYTINVTRSALGEDPPVKPVEKPVEEIPEEPEVPAVALGLKSLSITGIDFLPLFDKNITSYVCEIEADVEKLDIIAVSEPEDAIIEITGNENFKTGENIVTISVKAKDGEEIVTYQITVNKLEPAVVGSVEEDNTQAGIFTEANKNVFIVAGAILGIVVISGLLNIILYIENYKIRASNGVTVRGRH